MSSTTIAEASNLIRNRQLRPSQHVDECLARIARFEDAVRAWVLVDEQQVRQTADVLDQEAAAGKLRGPLHGIPLGIKDIVDVRGLETRAGTPLLVGNVAPSDATIVRRLREAGAIILGKTVTTEFASFDPPTTRNPWNLERTPGGSSSGSAAGVAAGMCLGAIGSQTGGSITRPASYCGIAGCKPTYGRVSLNGIVPLSYSMDHPGPLARSVADLAMLLHVIAGPDLQDPHSSAVPVDDYFQTLRQFNQPPRFGTLPSLLEEASWEVQSVVRAAQQTLLSHGAETVSCPEDVLDLEQVTVWHRRIMAVEAAMHHRKWFPQRRDQYGSELAALLDEGLATTSSDYAQARFARAGARHRLLSALERAGQPPLDALLTPATTTTAVAAGTTGSPRFNSPWSYLGLPTVSIPCGLADDGLPVSLQLVGRPFGESRLLAAAAWCEQHLQFRARPPLD